MKLKDMRPFLTYIQTPKTEKVFKINEPQKAEYHKKGYFCAALKVNCCINHCGSLGLFFYPRISYIFRKQNIFTFLYQYQR